MIQALNPAEKRYFKIFAEKQQSKRIEDYLELYDLLAGQEEYDEEALIQALGSKPAILKQLSLLKNRLYVLLLKALASYHQQHSIEAELSEQLHHAELLYDKGLYDHSIKLLGSTRKVAERHQCHHILLRIILLEKRLMERNHYERSKGSAIEQLHRREMRILEQLHIESDLWSKKSQIFLHLFQKGRLRNPELARQMEPEIQALLVQAEEAGSSFKSRYLALHMQGAFYFALAEYEKTREVLEKSLHLLDKHPALANADPARMSAVLLNLAYVSAKLMDFKAFDHYQARSKKLAASTQIKLMGDLQFHIFIHSSSLELSVSNLYGDLERGRQILEELEKKLPSCAESLSEVRKASFYHGISTMYFLMGELSLALKWNNLLLNEIHIDQAEDQYCFAQMFHMVLHVEKENWEVLPTVLRSLERYLNLRDRKYAFETAFIRLIKQLLRTSSDPVGRRGHMQEFSELIASLEGKGVESSALEYFDFHAWAKSRISEVPMAELLQQKRLEPMN